MRPTALPEWASSATNIAEPLTATKQSGHATNGIASSAYQNWLDSLTYKWLRFLSLSDPIIYDDFVRGPAISRDGGGTSAASALAPIWEASGAAGDISWVDPISVLGGAGAIAVARNASGLTYLKTAVGELREADFRLEILARVAGRGSSIGYVELGGLSGIMAFTTTGPTGPWSFRFTRSGGSATGMSLGIAPETTTGIAAGGAFHRFAVERFGQTMVVEFNDVPYITIGNAVLAPQLEVGANVYKNGGVAGQLVYIDKIDLRAKR